MGEATERYFAVSEDGAVRLRAMQPRDAKRLHRMWNEKAVAESFREGLRARPYAEAESFIFFARSKGSSGKDLAIEYQGHFVGCLTWQYGVGVWQGSAELSYWVGGEYWGRGIASSAVGMAMPFLFDSKGMHRLYAEVAGENIASARVLEKCGFRREGVMRSALTIDGRQMDCLIYGKLKREYEREKRKK